LLPGVSMSNVFSFEPFFFATTTVVMNIHRVKSKCGNVRSDLYFTFMHLAQSYGIYSPYAWDHVREFRLEVAFSLLAV
jgi:hypothetical protein